MDDEAARVIKHQLDDELAAVSSHAGISLGHELYREFVQRGWITNEKLTIVGIGTAHVTAAYGTHPAHIGASLGDLDFEVLPPTA